MISKALIIIRIAWRSIWRSKRRTLISIFSIVIGTGLPTFTVCLGWGFYNGLIDDVARLMAGHVTYEHVEYRNSPSNDLWVDDMQAINSALNNDDDVVSTKQMVILQGVAHTAKGAVGVSLMGIEPLKEISISLLSDSIVTGELCIEALNFAIDVLKKNGQFVSKIFMGSTFNEIVTIAKKNFIKTLKGSSQN